MRPNLFSFATSELSQDAFLCWLLAWADQENAAIDPSLHRIGVRFVQHLVELYNQQIEPTASSPGEKFSIDVRRQELKIDVRALVGDSLALIIEDKTLTSNHSEQLLRYREAAAKRWPDRTLVCLYVKTGDQAHYGYIRDKGFAVVTRSDLLGLLRNGLTSGVRDSIYLDFLAYLEGIEADVNSWRTAAPSSWSGGAWRGFFMAIQDQLGCWAGWGYVPNQTGGFMGFWWNFHKVGDTEIYLQLEESLLCIKVKVSDSNQRTRVRNLWSQRVLAMTPPAGLLLQRPNRFGHGKYMTIAQLSEDHRVLDSGGRLDLNATLGRLQALTRFVARAASRQLTVRVSGGKYLPLQEYLERSGEDEVALDFATFEQILGAELPPSARSNRTWWGNTTNTQRVQAHAWMGAGYRVNSVDLAGQRVVFRRAPQKAHPPEPEA